MVGGRKSWKVDNRKVEIIDMKNESFTCNGIDDFPLPEHFKAFIPGVGGLVEGTVPFFCGTRESWRTRIISECIALKNKKWEFAPKPKLARSTPYIGRGKCVYNCTYLS